MADPHDKQLPRRTLSEGDLRALSHPLRLQLLELLSEGASTATRLAERLGESSGATSYHLRALARYGFVEDAASGHGRRERWWQLVPETTEIGAGTSESEAFRDAATQLRSIQLNRSARVLGEYLVDEENYPPEWREAAAFIHATIYATPEELIQLGNAIAALLESLTRTDAANRPEDAERVWVTARALPWWTPGRRGFLTSDRSREEDPPE